MKISIREACNNDGKRKVLHVFRPRMRSHIIASAYEAPSGLWTVSLPGAPIDAARDEKHAREIINKFFNSYTGVLAL